MTRSPASPSILWEPDSIRVEVLAESAWPDRIDATFVALVPPEGLSEPDAAYLAHLTDTEPSRWQGPAPGDTTWPVPERVALVPLGDDPDLHLIGAQVGRLAQAGKVLDCLLPELTEAQQQAMSLAASRGAHNVRSRATTTVRLWQRGDDTAAATAGAAVGRRVLLARDLGNEPSNSKTPHWLAERAHDVAGGSLRVRTMERPELERLGFGGVLAVGAGSQHEPRVTIMEYRGAAAGPHIVLVGKGITFDSGGLSLKPPPGMPLMKTDMTGAAAVIGTLAAARDLALEVRVTGVLAIAENMPSGSAMRPGDVIRHYGGRTSEVLNTDAEGRLVLADCLAYAADRLRPDVVIDIASLTGAATLGLGRQHAALYSRHDDLAAQITAAGVAGADRVWRMPLVDDYRAAIDSDVADAANTATDPHTSAGSITAALFLEPFAGGVRWAHLDIAGAARTESDRADCRKGATGFGVSLLTQWLSDLARAQ